MEAEVFPFKKGCLRGWAVVVIPYLYALKMKSTRFFLFAGLLLMGSCLDEPDCFRLSNNYIGISFKKIFDGKADTLSFLGITSPASDSIFYESKLASAIQLELNPFETTTLFTMETTYGNHQLEMEYKNSIQFVSEDCGVRTTLSNLVIKSIQYDSFKVVSNVPTNPAQTNLELYRCPRTHILKLSFRKQGPGGETADTVQLQNVSADYPVNFFFPTDKITAITLPLNRNAASTTFTFEFIDASTRTITIEHNRITGYSFSACTGLTLFNKLKNGGSDFSQVTLLRDSVFDPPLTNFALFK